MFRRAVGKPDVLCHLDRIEDWLRARFSLAPDCLVLVSEQPSIRPGYPPMETTALFWTDSEARYRLTFFKPAAEVEEADLPPSWLLPSLLDDGDAVCC